MAKIRIVDTDSAPVCPHCSKELTIIERIAKGIIEQTMVFICPFCKKVLSVGYSNGWT